MLETIICIIIVIVIKIIEIIINKYFINNENIDYNNKYIKKEYLLTQTELKFYKLLKQITDEMNLKICPQVNLYQIIKTNNYKYFNKISNKCIDFVITEQNLKIKFCIELDDYTHNQPKRRKRDEFINKLFNELNIKLIRIPVQNYYNIEELKLKIKRSDTYDNKIN